MRNDIFAEKLPAEIQSNKVIISGAGLWSFSINIKTATTNEAKTLPLAIVPVKPFDRLRFTKPMIAQLMSGNRGINQTKCDIIYVLPPQYLSVFNSSIKSFIENMLIIAANIPNEINGMLSL